MSRLFLGLAALLFVAGAAAIPDDAQAGPLCSTLSVSLAEFESCVVEGEQDFLPNVQAALDEALTVSVVLQGAGSFCPGPECEGSEFMGSDPGAGFVIDPETLPGSISFTFEELPPGTQFIVLKQANDFEIFKVPGPTPFTLTHQLPGEDTSHISTFIPEPTTALLLSAGLATLATRRRSR